MKKMLKTLLSSAVLLSSFMVSAQNVAVVNGKAIPKARADFMISEMVKQGRPKSAELEKSVAEELINREVLVQAAVKAGLEKKEAIKMQIDLASQGVLIRALAENFIATNKVSDQEVNARYDEYKKQMGDTQYHARHVLLEKEEQAKDIIAKLKKGEKFEDLAKQSKDTGSAQSGGDLGWASASSFVKPFSDAMIALKPNMVTDMPVKTDFGFHVIQLIETRPTEYQKLEDLKPEIERDIQGAKLQAYQEKLRKDAKIQ